MDWRSELEWKKKLCLCIRLKKEELPAALMLVKCVSQHLESLCVCISGVRHIAQTLQSCIWNILWVQTAEEIIYRTVLFHILLSDVPVSFGHCSHTVHIFFWLSTHRYFPFYCACALSAIGANFLFQSLNLSHILIQCRGARSCLCLNLPVSQSTIILLV